MVVLFICIAVVEAFDEEPQRIVYAKVALAVALTCNTEQLQSLGLLCYRQRVNYRTTKTVLALSAVQTFVLQSLLGGALIYFYFAEIAHDAYDGPGTTKHLWAWRLFFPVVVILLLGIQGELGLYTGGYNLPPC